MIAPGMAGGVADGMAGGKAGSGEARDYERIEAAIRFIDAHALEQPALADMAAAVGLSEHHFHRLFREWAGITPKRFLQLLTLEHAKRRLEESRTVLEASFRTGLSGPSRLHDLWVTLGGVTRGEPGAGGAGVEIRWGRAPTPFGSAFIASTDRGVCHLSFGDRGDEYEHDDADGDGGGDNVLDSAASTLRELTTRWPGARLRRDDEAALALRDHIFARDPVPLEVRGTNFQVQVWQALLRIPPGAVASYGDLAAAVGRPTAVRAVAGAVASNRIGWLIPCHRVIRKLGEAGGYRWGGVRKRAMLAREAAGSS